MSSHMSGRPSSTHRRRERRIVRGVALLTFFAATACLVPLEQASAETASAGTAYGSGTREPYGETFSFNATGSPESATGTMSFESGFDNPPVVAEVRCLGIRDDGATISGIITSSPGEPGTSSAVGNELIFQVQDNATPGDGQDRISISYGAPMTGTCQRPWDDTGGGALVRNGDIVVRGASADSATTLTLTPGAATNPVGTQHTVTASVTNVAAGPAADTAVLFSVRGSTTTSGQCTTSAGSCNFTYTGPDMPGADAITACADVNSNGTCDPGEPQGEATKAWVLPTSTSGQTTGGGQLDRDGQTGSVAFGYTAKNSGDTIKGECTLVDIAPDRNIKVKCVDVDTLVQTATHATFFGNGTINGTPTRYRIDVDDNAEPGAGHDTFKLTTSTGYSAGGVISKGNIQVHD